MTPWESSISIGMLMGTDYVTQIDWASANGIMSYKLIGQVLMAAH